MLYKKRTAKLKSYAKAFCDKVCQDLEPFGYLITTEYPKIIFYRQRCEIVIAPGSTMFDNYGDDFKRSPKGNLFAAGYFDCENDTIKVFNVTGERPENLKTTIRHECLHFLLFKSGMPSNDDDAMFLALTILYDAEPQLYPDEKKFREVCNIFAILRGRQ